jgi:thiol-disulfide isomerase/thioredoxin
MIKNIVAGFLVLMTIGNGAMLYKKYHKVPGGGPSDRSNWERSDDWDRNVKPNPDVKPDAPKDDEKKPEPKNIQVQTFDEAKVVSGELGKPILIFFTAEWCPYCKEMAAKVLTDKSVKDMMANYIVVSIDIDADKATAKKFGVQRIPAHIVTNSKEAKLKHVEKAMSAKEYLTWLNDPKMFTQPKGSPTPPKPEPPKEEDQKKRRGRRQQPPQRPSVPEQQDEIQPEMSPPDIRMQPGRS